MRYKEYDTDLCVVGGGLAGLCAALSAARHGIKVVLMQDRPVLGGNASSEIRMQIGGARGFNNRETGLIEELILENYYRNTSHSYSVWDSVLYGKAISEKNITLLLNCTCQNAETDPITKRILSVTGWQLNTETYHTVKAGFFADCSGDSILAPLTEAEYTIGRESRELYGESIAPVEEDNKTMGMSCLLMPRETDSPKEYIPPEWAYKYETDDELPRAGHNINTNFWWIELGGTQDCIHDSDELRDELLKIAFGVWDHMKNRGNHGCENWELDWVGFLPGKRESRRYHGAYVVTQNDVEAGGRFEDNVAYAGWTMDDHFPEGFYYRKGHPTIYHPAPSPWGIPYRALYSVNIPNLFFAGRNISVTHSALSSSRVMATCAVVGQAVGCAAALAVKSGVSTPDMISINELQKKLLWDDCFIPGFKREIDEKTALANTEYDMLKDGNDRENPAVVKIGEAVIYEWETPVNISEVRIIFDSDLNRNYDNMPYNFPLQQTKYNMPDSMTKDYIIEVVNAAGKTVIITEVYNNHVRLAKHRVGMECKKLKLIPKSTWGNNDTSSIFTMETV